MTCSFGERFSSPRATPTRPTRMTANTNRMGLSPDLNHRDTEAQRRQRRECSKKELFSLFFSFGLLCVSVVQPLSLHDVDVQLRLVHRRRLAVEQRRRLDDEVVPAAGLRVRGRLQNELRLVLP